MDEKKKKKIIDGSSSHTRQKEMQMAALEKKKYSSSLVSEESRSVINHGCFFQFSSVQSLSHVRLFAPPWTAACQAFLSTTNSWSLLKLMSIELVMPSNHLNLCGPFSCLQSFPASGTFQMGQFFTSGAQRFGVSASASVLAMNIQD